MSAEIRRTVIYFTKIIQLLSNQSTIPVAEDYLQPFQDYLPVLQPLVADFLTRISTSDFREVGQTASVAVLSAAQKMIEVIGTRDYLAQITQRAAVDRMSAVWHHVYAGIPQIGAMEEHVLTERMTD